MAGKGVLILQFFSVAEAVEVFQVVEVALAARTYPDHPCGVGEVVGNPIDARKGEACVAGKVFHENDAHLIAGNEREISSLLFFDDESACLRAVGGFGRQVLGDGGHQAVGITVVVVGGVMVLRCPNICYGALGYGLVMLVVGSVDIEQLEELFVGCEGLTAFQYGTVVEGCS